MLSRINNTTAKIACVLAVTLPIVLGCEDPSLPAVKTGVEAWKPTPVGGVLELRPLPPASQILDDYRKWMEEEPASAARVYEATLVGASNQLRFRVEVTREDTPMGRPEHTYATFAYNDPTNGSYEMLWHRLGRHDADFLRLGDRPRRVWLELNWRASKPAQPLLQIVAFEGVEPFEVLVAMPGGAQK
jgi:hypothetical protein